MSGKTKIESPEIKISGMQLFSEHFWMALHKLHATPTANYKASHINKIFTQAKKLKDEYTKEFQDMVGLKHAKKDEKGEIIRPPGNPQGIEPVDMKAYMEEEENFIKKIETVIKWKPLTPDIVSDCKISGKEIEVLGDLYVETEPGPGAPHLRPV